MRSLPARVVVAVPDFAATLRTWNQPCFSVRSYCCSSKDAALHVPADIPTLNLTVEELAGAVMDAGHEK